MNTATDNQSKQAARYGVALIYREKQKVISPCRWDDWDDAAAFGEAEVTEGRAIGFQIVHDDPSVTEDAAVMKKILHWLAGPNTGLSSEAMAYCRLGIPRRGHWNGKEHPSDPADFNRCLLLVKDCPEVKESFVDIAALSESWNAIIAHWYELQDLFVSEVGWNWSKGHQATETYERMREILPR
jgi:hypothetical protein